MKKASSPREVEDFEEIPNVGPRTAADFRRLGIKRASELRSRDPYAMYAALCQSTGTTQDPCVIDVFISATRFMRGEPARPWWAYTEERKAVLAKRAGKKRPAPAGKKR
ncbi:MAG TPA: helix-hairpin-helix domain-containing protein [Polyangiaceae bacterium]